MFFWSAYFWWGDCKRQSFSLPNQGLDSKPEAKTQSKLHCWFHGLSVVVFVCSNHCCWGDCKKQRVSLPCQGLDSKHQGSPNWCFGLVAWGFEPLHLVEGKWEATQLSPTGSRSNLFEGGQLSGLGLRGQIGCVGVVRCLLDAAASAETVDRDGWTEAARVRLSRGRCQILAPERSGSDCRPTS